MPVPPEIFARIYRRHGHRCPMSTLGGRLGLAARGQLPAGKAEGVYFIRTCALDGIAETTGCREADGTLRVEERGEHRLRLTAAGTMVETALRPEALAIAGRYRRASDSLELDRAGLDGAVLKAREAELAAILDEVLQALWTLPDESLLVVRLLSAEKES